MNFIDGGGDGDEKAIAYRVKAHEMIIAKETFSLAKTRARDLG